MITPRKKVQHFGQLIGGCPICGYEVHWYDGTHYRGNNFGNYHTYLRCENGHQFEDEAMQEILETCGFERTDNRCAELDEPLGPYDDVAGIPGLQLQAHKREAMRKAIDNLARYKFNNFGYWAGIWVHLNQIDGKEANPFRPLVEAARKMKGETQ